jgi:hypothetical protein
MAALLPSIIKKQSSSPRFPCPDGTSIGYGEWNGTIFLICDSFSVGGGDSLELGLGLGLGLGLPILLCLICAVCVKFKSLGYSLKPVLPLPSENQAPVFLDTHMIIKELSEKAYADFCFDNLTDTLKHELMVLRIRKGKNLTDFVKLAERRNAVEVANWIDRMNPGEFPKEIHQEAIKPREAEP